MSAHLLKFLNGRKWDNATNDLTTDLEHIESALNARPLRGGQAQLVGGTVLVPTRDIRATSVVFLQRKVSSGTLGTLSYTQVNNESLTINSSSTTDTSIVNWLIFDVAF